MYDCKDVLDFRFFIKFPSHVTGRMFLVSWRNGSKNLGFLFMSNSNELENVPNYSEGWFSNKANWVSWPISTTFWNYVFINVTKDCSVGDLAGISVEYPIVLAHVLEVSTGVFSTVVRYDRNKEFTFLDNILEHVQHYTNCKWWKFPNDKKFAIDISNGNIMYFLPVYDTRTQGLPFVVEHQAVCL